tara:strand:- start:361 stop:1116 length:756 start_codon:yes stop_codon:yes gene_type:complete
MQAILISCLLFSNLFSEDLFDQGIAWYNKRSETIEGLYAKNDNIDNAIKFFKKDLDQTKNQETALYLLKSYYFKGKYATQDENLKKDLFSKGKALAEEYIVKYPNSADIRYWYLVNLGSWAEVYGKLKAAREGVADIMKEQSEKIIKLDLEYKNGGGYFMLGAVHLKSPYIPFLLSWPNKKEAVKYLQMALNTGQSTLVQKKYLAHALHKIGSTDKAVKIINEVINSKPSMEDQLEDLNDIHEAKELLKTF